jgi:hypothetical protein
MGIPRKGIFNPKNPQKYKGNYPIIWRSSWELKFMAFLDNRIDVSEWSSESVIVPYYHPLKKRMARYYPDFLVTFKDREGKFTKYLIEVKPLKETIAPINKAKKKKKTQLYEELTYIVNQEKWKAAQDFCKINGLKFQIITEKELFKFK